MMYDYEAKGGIMQFGGMDATEIAREFGTPVYVTDEQRLRTNYRNVYAAFSKHMDTEVHYACKANTSLAILRILESEGSHIDAVSVGEVQSCLKAGFPPERIMFTGCNVSDRELGEVVGTGCRINIDSESEMERLAKILGPDAKGFPISVRVTPGVSSGHGAKVMTGGKGAKFGIPKERVVDAYARAKELGFRTVGIHAHTGSGGHTVEPFIDVVEILIDLVNEIEEKVGCGFDFIDFGGGLGVPYKPQEEETDLEDLAVTICDMIKDGTDVGTVALEPGRYLVCDTTVILATCVDVKDAGPKKYVGIDAGFNTLIRPAFYDSYHHVALANKFNKACTAKYEVVGPLCETGDYIAHDRILPDPQEGDIVVIYNAGAYGFSMSSVYNSRPRCREVLVNNGEAELIRDAETMEDIWRHQIIPGRLLR